MMETLGYILGLVALVWCISLSTKLSRLERIMKASGITDSDKASLKEILEKNIGKRGKIVFESDSTDYEIGSKFCQINDIDENWILVKEEKHDIEKLIRIESVKSIQFK